MLFFCLLDKGTNGGGCMSAAGGAADDAADGAAGDAPGGVLGVEGADEYSVSAASVDEVFDVDDVAAAVDEPVGASIGVDRGCGATGAILYAICCRSSSPSESRSLLSRRRGHACSSLVVPEAGEGATLLLGYSRVSLLLPAFPLEFLCFSVFEPFFA